MAAEAVAGVISPTGAGASASAASERLGDELGDVDVGAAALLPPNKLANVRGLATAFVGLAGLEDDCGRGMLSSISLPTAKVRAGSLL